MVGKRILLIYPNNFLKNNAGNNTYTYNIVKTLKSLGYNIDFLTENYFDDFSNVNELNKKNNNLLDNIYIFKGKIRQTIHDYTEFSWVNDDFLKFFQKIIHENTYDYIYIHYVNFLDLIKFSKINDNVKVIFSVHDFESLQIFYNTNSLENFGKIIEDEIKLFGYADEVLCISNDELSFLSRFYPQKTFRLLPHFIDKKQLKQTTKNIDCLFIGYCNQYNLDAVKWFIDNVYNHLMPNIKVTICGKVCEMIKKNSPDYYKKMIDYNFNLIDFAEDLDELHKRTKIAIVPIQGGTGLKIKTITAMSYGMPIVSTPLGVDGFIDKSQNGCLVTDDGKQFAYYINKLLTDNEFYNNTSNNISEYFDKHFSSKIGQEVLQNAFFKDENFVSSRASERLSTIKIILSLVKWIFSVKDSYKNKKNHKVITILGMKLKIKVRG